MADEDFLSSFLYGEGKPIFQHEGIHVSLLMTPKTAGWVDKPHGGFSMGVLTDLAFRIIGRKQTELYPLTVSFRLGGSSLTIGDRVTFHASPHDGAIEGIGLVDGSSQPCIEATIHFQAKDSPASHHPLPPIPSESLIILPNYRNCLVCGTERIDDPGLKIRFHLSLSNGTKTVLAPIFDDTATDFYRFLRNDILHPLAILAPLDELLGWAGFMITAHGAVTVQFQAAIYRPVREGEKLVFFGNGLRTRGTAGRRLMFWSSGGVMALRKEASPEVVAVAEGQYYCLETLTEQMKRHLLPEELTARAFRIAGGSYP